MNFQNERSPGAAKHWGSNKSILAVSSNNQNPNGQDGFSQEQIDQLLECLPERANQARRFVVHLAQNPGSKTSVCNVEVLAVNLSDLAAKYNPYLRSAGYELRCRLPEKRIENRLGEPTMQYLWSLKKLGGEDA